MRKISSKVVLAFFVSAVVIVGAFLYIQKFRSSREYVSPRVGDVVETIYGLGTVTADQEYHLRVAVTSEVRKLFVQEGHTVAKNTPLIRLDDNTFKSPLDGVVTRIAFKEGELVAPQVPVLTVTNLARLYLEVSLEQQSTLRVKRGQPVYISFESMRNEKLTGEVATIYPRENQFIVRVEIKDWPAMNILPGMTADVAILVGEKKQVLLIPVKSIIAGQATRRRDGRNEKIRVKLGSMDGEWAEVLSNDLLPSDQILVRH